MADALETRPTDSNLFIPSYRVQGEGPLLVNIAGLDGTGEMIFKQMPSLSRLYRVVSFRQRDHGQFTYEDLANDVAGIIRNLDESRATIVAESFGGGVALTFALRYPEMVDRLVIVNSFPRYRERIRIKLAAKLAEVVPFRLVFPVRFVASLLGLKVDGVTAEDRRRFFEIIRRIDGNGYARRLKLISELDLDDRLPEIKVPTLLIGTEHDLLVRSIREAHFMASRIPHARVRIIRGVGHACLLGSRVNLADIITEWVNSD
ncbi:MAG TPA: alpha/beta hydrolase [Blastocatellia bacterium]|nr:alpha/beta hydrolase [Blastocatellia bacterium]